MNTGVSGWRVQGIHDGGMKVYKGNTGVRRWRFIKGIQG